MLHVRVHVPPPSTHLPFVFTDADLDDELVALKAQGCGVCVCVRACAGVCAGRDGRTFDPVLDALAELLDEGLGLVRVVLSAGQVGFQDILNNISDWRRGEPAAENKNKPRKRVANDAL